MEFYSIRLDIKLNVFGINSLSKQYNKKYIVYILSFIHYSYLFSIAELSKMAFEYNKKLYPEDKSSLLEQRTVEFTSVHFDDAHNHWIQNKRKLANGMYRYICIGVFKTGKSCNRNPLVGQNTCKIHHQTDPTTHEESKIDSESEHQNTFIETQQKHKPQSLANETDNIELTKKSVQSNDVCENSVATQKRRSSNNHQKWFTIEGFWKSYRTLPVDELRYSRRNDVRSFVGELTDTRPPPNVSHESTEPILNVYDETIRIHLEPTKYVPFKQLRRAFDKYVNIDRIRNPETIRKNRYNILDVAYYLQVMLIFMEGLNEMTKLSTKHVCVMTMKTHLLQFMNCDTNILHTTESKWRQISNHIQDEILYVSETIFEEIGE